MQPEVSGQASAGVPGTGAWFAWPLLVLCALPVGITAVVARRVLTGSSTVYGELPGGLPLRERAALLLNYSTNEIHLLVPLLALLALLWLARPGAQRPPPSAVSWCGAVLAGLIGLMALGVCGIVGYLLLSDEQVPGDVGFLGPRESLLEVFGARVATSLLLAALAAGLAGALVSAARRPWPMPHVPAHGEPEAAMPAEPKPAAPEPEAVDADPHARFRRPS